VTTNNKMASADKHIRAWTFTHEGYPKALRRSTLVSPSTPAATEVHVRIKAAALNPVDIQLMNLPIWKYLPISLLPSDKGIGEDFSGVVEAAGKNSGFDVGDDVRSCIYHLVLRINRY
jgi:NADPH:quinone reductase-like Zn-dependent oxidoreductase